MELYKPANCKNLKESEGIQQIRLGIQGYPKTGKTFSALSFPNPVVLNMDRGLGIHVGREDVIEVELWNDSYCKTINKEHKSRADVKDTLMLFLEKEAPKLASIQTLVVDGSTPINGAFHRWFQANQYELAMTKGNKINEFAEWNYKLQFFSEMFDHLKTLKCNVVYLCHEIDKPEKATSVGGDARYTGKIRPLMTGQFKDEIVSHFTDFFRQHSAEKPTDDKLTPEALSNWNMDKKEFKAFLDTFPGKTFYFWQTTSDDIFDGGFSSMINPPKFVPPYYSSFEKYRKKISQ